MDEYNVFNSFSFKKWAKYVRERRLEEEMRRQRMEQVIRLRNKLIRERALRDQVDLLTDEDVDKLVHYINTAGKSFAGIATGIKSTVRFGKQAAGTSTIPSISAAVRALSGQALGQIGQSKALQEQQQMAAAAAENEEEVRPTELSERLPPDEPRDVRYFFGEVPILAPLHSKQLYSTLQQQQEEPQSKQRIFQHNIRYSDPKANAAKNGMSSKGTPNIAKMMRMVSVRAPKTSSAA